MDDPRDIVLRLQGVPLTGDTSLQSATLESLATVKHYHAWLTDLALPYLGDHPLELGSGFGDYAQAWLDAGIPTLTLTELDPERSARLSSRFASEPRIRVEKLDILHPPEGRYSSLVAYNVLEHIDDHVGALRAAHRLVVPGGAVIMFVPAFMFAMGRFDRTVGHLRRYTTSSLRAAYAAAGVRVERMHYVNAPGLAAWFVGVRLMQMTPGDSLALQVWDKTVTRASRAVEGRVSPPFGQSIFAVGRLERRHDP